jgi:hypothetical protein
MVTRKLLNTTFRNLFGQSHVAERVNRLIGRDVYEPIGAAFKRRHGNVSRAQDVIANCLVRVKFKQSHVLVRSGVEDGLWPLASQNIRNGLFAYNVDQQRLDIYGRKTFTQLSIDIEEAILRFVEQQQATGTSGRNLPAEFGPDAPSGPSDQDTPLCHNIANLCRVILYLVALQYVLNSNLVEVMLRGSSA